jgi:hypothetical protein
MPCSPLAPEHRLAIASQAHALPRGLRQSPASARTAARGNGDAIAVGAYITEFGGRQVVRFHFIFSAVIAFVAATMLTKCGNSSVVWEHYDQCALENPSFLAMAECGRRKRLAACEPNNTCSPEGTMFMQYVDSLVLSVKKKQLTEAEAMRRYTQYKSGGTPLHP